MISLFVNDGLAPFIRSHGYEWTYDDKWVKSVVATGLYENADMPHLNSKWACPTNTNFIPEDLDQFHHVIDSDKWDAFWESWGAWEDVDLVTPYGSDRRLDIMAFVWDHIDVNRSKQSVLVNQALDDNNGRDDGDGRNHIDDVYIRESTESNEWGGYRR